ncbi:MAG: DUF1015 domain-containing protein [Acidobacteriota bacterium]|nr:DUF1015 domain-containing protein [Acidobacteriota bacterium]
MPVVWYAESMPGFEPFAGLRYDPSVPLDAVIAPPYDVVGPEERAELASRHRANAIHVELPAEEPSMGLDRYANAARLLGEWTEKGTLLEDATPAFYGYRMTAPGASPTTGVIGALACEPIGGDILPHEQTIPKDRSDRLDLLRAARANLSPIWGLSLTEGLATLYRQTEPADAKATDDDGVLHELWVMDDPALIEAIRVSVGSSPVVIADGHHRYETALAYQAERRAARDGARGDYDLVMALVVELAPGQLTVGPIHRTIVVPSGTDLVEAFSRWFDLVRAGPVDEDVVNAVADSGALALVTASDVWLLTAREEAYTAAESDLDSSILAMVAKEIPGAAVEYNHDWRTVVSAVVAGGAQAAVLIRPVTVEQIGDWAHARRRMPPKSTYFFPKPRTGMVFRPVRG